MKPVDNHDLAALAEVVFANSSGYYVELPMVGREAETVAMLDVLADEGVRHTVSLTAPLGAGKTFFLNTVLGRHHRDHPSFDDRRNCKFVLATEVIPPVIGAAGPDHIGLSATASLAHTDQLPVDSLDLESRFSGVEGRQVLVIEELDRKATLGQIRWTVAGGLAWLARRDNRVLILTGDLTLTGHHIGEFLAEAPNVHALTLPPLDVDLLKLALRARLHDKLLTPSHPEASADELAAAASVAAEEILSDDFIQWSVTPKTDPALLATFRDALGILRTYAENAPSLTGQVRFGRELIKSLPLGNSALAGHAAALEIALRAEVRRAIEEDRPLSALSVEELAAIAGQEVTASYRKRVIRAVARKSLLVPIGIPYEEEFDLQDEEPASFVGPFVPSYRMIHHAMRELIEESG